MDHAGAPTAAVGVTVVSGHHTQQSLERLGTQVRSGAEQLSLARGFRPGAEMARGA